MLAKAAPRLYKMSLLMFFYFNVWVLYMTEFERDEQESTEVFLSSMMDVPIGAAPDMQAPEYSSIPAHIQAQIDGADDEDLGLWHDEYQIDEDTPVIYTAPPESDARPVKWDDSAPAPDDYRKKLLKIREKMMSQLSTPEFVVDGLFPAGAPGIVFGASGTKKSFFAVHVSCSVAAGLPVFGMGVRKGLVIYFAPEDAGGVYERVRGWEENYNGGKPLENFMLIPSPLALNNDVKLQEWIDNLHAVMSLMPESERNVAMIVCDTLSANCAGMNIGADATGRGGHAFEENSNTDVAYVMNRAEQVASKLNTAMMFIHHSGKDSAKGARGASALKANASFEIEIKSHKPTGGIIVHPTKIKMAASLEPRVVVFSSQPLPKDVIAMKSRSKARLCQVPEDNNPARWETKTFNSTLVASNRVQIVTSSDVENDSLTKEEKRELTQVERLTLYIRKESGHHGVSRDDLRVYMTSALKVRPESIGTLIKRAIDKQYITKTPAGNYKHTQTAMMIPDIESATETPRWEPSFTGDSEE